MHRHSSYTCVVQRQIHNDKIRDEAVRYASIIMTELTSSADVDTRWLEYMHMCKYTPFIQQDPCIAWQNVLSKDVQIEAYIS